MTNPSSASHDEPSTEQQPRLRACNACREAKTKCVAINGQSKCRYCHKHGKHCVVPATRKPRIKTAEKLAALEKQIQTLSTTLEKQKSSSVLNSSVDEHYVPNVDRREATHDVVAGSRPSVQTIQLLLNHWNMSMQRHHPIVGTIDADVSFEGIGQTPITVMVVLCIASLAILPAISKDLIERTNQELIRKVYLCEEQSTDLVTALLLHSQFLTHHVKSAKLRFSPHTYTASVMAVDLGLGKKSCVPPAYDNPNAANSARAWLGRYCAVSISMSLLDRQRLANEDSDIELVMTNLVGCRYSTPSDIGLCDLVKLHQIVNESARTASVSHQSRWNGGIIDSETIQLNHRLDDWIGIIARRSHQTHPDTTIVFLYHAVKLYIHRLAIVDFRLKLLSMIANHQPLPNSSPTQEHSFNVDHGLILQNLQAKLSPDHMSALNLCTELCHQSLRTFMALPVPTARDLPLSHYYWIVFISICVLKLAPLAEDLRQPTSTSKNETEIGPSPSTQLQLCANKLEQICQNGHSPQLNVFRDLVRKLQTYYIRRIEVCISTQVDCYDHSAGIQGGKVLNLFKDDLHETAVSGEEETIDRESGVTPNVLHHSRKEDFVVGVESHGQDEFNENLMQKMDRFFDQEDDGQWLALLNWDQT